MQYAHGYHCALFQCDYIIGPKLYGEYIPWLKFALVHWLRILRLFAESSQRSYGTHFITVLTHVRYDISHHQRFDNLFDSNKENIKLHITCCLWFMLQWPCVFTKIYAHRGRFIQGCQHRDVHHNNKMFNLHNGNLYIRKDGLCTFISKWGPDPIPRYRVFYSDNEYKRYYN